MGNSLEVTIREVGGKLVRIPAKPLSEILEHLIEDLGLPSEDFCVTRGLTGALDDPKLSDKLVGLTNRKTGIRIGKSRKDVEALDFWASCLTSEDKEEIKRQIGHFNDFFAIKPDEQISFDLTGETE